MLDVDLDDLVLGVVVVEVVVLCGSAGCCGGVSKDEKHGANKPFQQGANEAMT